MITTERVANGIFDVYYKGIKTNWQIINSSLGASGLGNNLYMIVNEVKGVRTTIGSLARCKKTLIESLKKDLRSQPIE